MAHDHSHQHASGNIKQAFWINLVFSIIEIIGGIFTNSISILSDALHDLGDSFSLGLAWYFEKISTKKRDETYTYGYRRFSLLGALINSVILLSGSLVIIIFSIPRILDPQPTQAAGMIWLAVLGIGFNGLAYYRLHRGHSHNERVVSLHLLEDILGWVAVLIGGVIILLTGWYIIDPILSLCIAAFILYNVFKSLQSTSRIILQGIPANISIGQISDKLSGLHGVLSFHDLHVWSMDGVNSILTVHLVVDPSTDIPSRTIIKNKLQRTMSTLGIRHCTIEFECPQEDCLLKEH